MNNRAVGIKRRGRARGNSHLSSGAEGAKGEGRRQSRGKHDQINVARKKDGDGQTDGNADVCTRTVGRGRRPQSRRAAGNGAGQRHAGTRHKNPAAARRSPFKIFSPRSVRKKSYALFPSDSVPPELHHSPKNGGGRVATTAKAPLSSLSDGNFTVRNADFARADQHAHRIRHRRSGAPDCFRDLRIAHERRRTPYPFPQVFIYPLGGGFQFVIVAHFYALSFALSRSFPFSRGFLILALSPRYGFIFAVSAGRSFFGGRSYFRSPCQQTYKEVI